MGSKAWTELSRGRTLGRASVAALLALSAWQAAASEGAVDRDGAARESPAVVVYVPVAPSLFVVAGRSELVMLHADVARGTDGAAAFSAGYLASADVADASAEGARRARDVAALILNAYSALLPEEVRTADVAAVYGSPGTMGVVLLTHLAREGGGWTVRGIGAPQRGLVPTVPISRSPAAEGAAETAARTFLRRADERDRDAAWALASPALKISLSRRSFEDVLWPDRSNAPRGARREVFRQYELRGPALGPGDVVLLCFATQTNVELVQMRLDDDQVWRVGGYARFGGADARPQDPPAAGAPRGTPKQVAANARPRGEAL